MPGPTYLSAQEQRVLDGHFEDIDNFRRRLSEDRGRAALSGEYMLRLAVLEDVAAVIASAATPDREFYRAVEYVQSTDTSWPYSFESLCLALSWDAEAMRRGLLALALGPRQGRRLVRGADLRGIRHRIAYSHASKVQDRQWREEKARKRRDRRRRANQAIQVAS